MKWWAIERHILNYKGHLFEAIAIYYDSEVNLQHKLFWRTKLYFWTLQKGWNWRYDTQHNDIQQSDTEHNNAKCLFWVSLCWMYYFPTVKIKSIMLSVVMLNVVMLNVVMLNVVMLNIVMLNVIMLNVVATLKLWTIFKITVFKVSPLLGPVL